MLLTVSLGLVFYNKYLVVVSKSLSKTIGLMGDAKDEKVNEKVNKGIMVMANQ